MRKLFAVVLVLAASLMALAAATALAAGRSVKVGDNYFVRPSGVPTVTVGRGTTVKWVFKGRKAHNVSVKSGPAKFHSTNKTRGSFAKTFNRKGTYVIFCSLHGSSDQTMRLVVR